MGDLVVDLRVDECPNACTNFLKLCKIKHYNNCLIYSVEKNFIARTGDPRNKGQVGSCIWNILTNGKQKYFDDEIRRSLQHDKMGVLAMSNEKPNENGSSFYITLRDKIDFLNEKHTIFGFVSEGLDVLEKLNEVMVDGENKPFNNVRILHTVILDDPFDDPPYIDDHIPVNSPAVIEDENFEVCQKDVDEITLLENVAKAEAKSRAINLELLGDLPDADMKPPENVLFVAKLNPVTPDEDLELIFSRFGTIVSCEVIKDWKTGDSLQYAFVEFESVRSAEEAYFKMQDCLVDDRRIHVDFSQSVAKHWNLFRRNGAKASLEDAEALPGGMGKGKGKGKGGKSSKGFKSGGSSSSTAKGESHPGGFQHSRPQEREKDGAAAAHRSEHGRTTHHTDGNRSRAPDETRREERRDDGDRQRRRDDERDHINRGDRQRRRDHDEGGRDRREERKEERRKEESPKIRRKEESPKRRRSRSRSRSERRREGREESKKDKKRHKEDDNEEGRGKKMEKRGKKGGKEEDDGEDRHEKKRKKEEDKRDSIDDRDQGRRKEKKHKKGH